jgi:hypothetical protein
MAREEFGSKVNTVGNPSDKFLSHFKRLLNLDRKEHSDKLRGSIEPAEYKHVVLGLIFLKFASDKFEQRKKELIEDGKEKYVEMKDFYTMKNVFFLENKLLYKNIMHFTIFVIFNVTLINALI